MVCNISRFQAAICEFFCFWWGGGGGQGLGISRSTHYGHWQVCQVVFNLIIYNFGSLTELEWAAVLGIFSEKISGCIHHLTVTSISVTSILYYIDIDIGCGTVALILSYFVNFLVNFLGHFVVAIWWKDWLMYF